MAWRYLFSKYVAGSCLRNISCTGILCIFSCNINSVLVQLSSELCSMFNLWSFMHQSVVCPIGVSVIQCGNCIEVSNLTGDVIAAMGIQYTDTSTCGEPLTGYAQSTLTTLTENIANCMPRISKIYYLI